MADDEDADRPDADDRSIRGDAVATEAIDDAAHYPQPGTDVDQMDH